ncbi:carbohydrate sulfotransferase 8-like [Babylonia areolata]|uniref:carbohydrate sulfotransferase 8-like n=1 Tax=Babylonia areolata TaxID=304850 RepID=UPI003FD0AA29
MLQSACSGFANSSAFNKLKVPEVVFPLYRPVMNLTVSYCMIPKVSSTTWKAALRDIRKYMIRQHVQDVPVNVSFGHRDVVFAAVREPYGRLLSAYVDKLFSPNARFWIKAGRYIQHHFGNNPSERSLQCGHGVTFPEFIRYFIHSQRTGRARDPHFVPLHEHCQFCDLPYHYIAHLETAAEDMPFILKAIRSPLPANTSHGPSKEGVMTFKTHMMLEDHLRELSQCFDLDEGFRRLWKTFQIRGFISKTQRFPFSPEQSRSMTMDEFVQVVTEAAAQSRAAGGGERQGGGGAAAGGGRWSLGQQRKEALREAWGSVPLEDRREVQRLLWPDFAMFGYDPQPEEVFPRQGRPAASSSSSSADPHFSYFDLYK